MSAYTTKHITRKQAVAIVMEELEGASNETLEELVYQAWRRRFECLIVPHGTIGEPPHSGVIRLTRLHAEGVIHEALQYESDSSLEDMVDVLWARDLFNCSIVSVGLEDSLAR